jgi:hypothetical protein
MEAIMRAVCEDLGCELVDFNGETTSGSYFAARSEPLR